MLIRIIAILTTITTDAAIACRHDRAIRLPFLRMYKKKVVRIVVVSCQYRSISCSKLKQNELATSLCVYANDSLDDDASALTQELSNGSFSLFAKG